MPGAEKLSGFVWIADDAFRYDGALWVRIKARRKGCCELSGRKIEKGDAVFRPVREAGVRRILASVLAGGSS